MRSLSTRMNRGTIHAHLAGALNLLHVVRSARPASVGRISRHPRRRRPETAHRVRQVCHPKPPNTTFCQKVERLHAEWCLHSAEAPMADLSLIHI